MDLLDVWEREAHRELNEQPSTTRAELLRKMAIARQAIASNVNNNLALEQIIL